MIMVGLCSCPSPKQTIKIKATKVKSDKPMEILAGEKIQKQPAKTKLIFSNPGDTRRFKQNDIVEIETQGVDFQDNTFSYINDPNSDSITIALLPRDNCEVTLANKCEVFYWNDPLHIPKVSIDSNINPEQIVVTPVFNNTCDCVRTGYQIRYGSTGSGCDDKGVIESLNKCKKQPIKIKKPSKDLNGNVGGNHKEKDEGGDGI